MSMFSLPTYLLLTPKGYFFRIRVPKHLQGALHRREIKKAIGGVDKRLAERQALLYAAQAIELFNSLEGAQVSYRFDMVVEVGDTRFILDKNKTKQELQHLIDIGVISTSAAASMPPTAATSATAATTTTSNRIIFDRNMLFSAAAAAHIEELKSKNAKFTEQKEKELKAKYDLLIDIIGDKRIGDIDYNDAKKFRETYSKLPRNRTSKNRSNMTIEQLIALGDPVKSTKNTINQRIDTICALFNWLISRNKAIENPFVNMHIQSMEGEVTTKTLKKRLPFDASDLAKIFGDKIWTKHHFNHDWEYWLPLLVLYTGVRITEACQLVKDDFKVVNGIWHMSINDLPTKDEPDEIWKKRVKTANALREIPIHSHLLKLGLRKYVESSPSNRIFPDIKPIADKIAKEPCRKFNDYVLKRTGAKVQHVKTLYSFRHTMLNELKQLRVSAEERAQLAGHAPVASDNNNASSVTMTHYGDDYNLSIMQELVEKLDFRAPLKLVAPWKERLQPRAARGAMAATIRK